MPPRPFSGRTNGSKSHPCAHFVRFTEEENYKLRLLIQRRKLSIQAFAHAAIMRALNEASMGMETDAEKALRIAVKEKPRSESSPATPFSLGIRERLEREEPVERREYERYEETAPPPSVAAPMVMMTAPSSSVTEIARTIVSLPVSSRRETLAAACRSLAHGRTREEAFALADELDREIKRLDVKPQTALEKARSRAMGRR